MKTKSTLKHTPNPLKKARLSTTSQTRLTVIKTTREENMVPKYATAWKAKRRTRSFKKKTRRTEKTLLNYAGRNETMNYTKILL